MEAFVRLGPPWETPKLDLHNFIVAVDGIETLHDGGEVEVKSDKG